METIRIPLGDLPVRYRKGHKSLVGETIESYYDDGTADFYLVDEVVSLDDGHATLEVTLL